MESEEQKAREKRNIIKIPSYQEVFQTSATPQPYNPLPPPPSSSSFSHAFSFLKSSEFYSSPPPPPQRAPPSQAAATSSQTPEPPPPPPPPPPSSTTSNAASTSSGNSRNAILVSHRQKGNPLLKHIRNVRWMFADVVCDYLLGPSSCALYISLRYHLLHPDYLYFRIRELQKNFKLRVVLCHVDVEDVVKPLLEVTRTAMLHDCTLLCGWSLEECGRYLETVKVYENKPADSIREQMDADYLSRLTHALTTIRHVNKTDVVTLGSTFGSLSHIMDASMEDLARCPGIGERKVKRLYDTFHEPFRRVSSRPTVVVPETPIKEKHAEEPLPPDNGGGAEGARIDASKDGKESNLNVKSALIAAFSKYAEKVRKRDRKGNLVEQGQSSSMASKDSET